MSTRTRNERRSVSPKPFGAQLDHYKKWDSGVDPTDPHDLDARFVSNQLLQFDDALSEITFGVKQTCWLWFVLPTAPHIVDGIEKGSSMNRYFALRGDDAVKAYLKFERKGVNLRINYLTIVKAVQEQLEKGTTMLRLFGPLDVNKAQSSIQLFRRISNEMGDKELASVCQNVLNLIALDKEKREIARIRTENPKEYRHVMTL